MEPIVPDSFDEIPPNKQEAEPRRSKKHWIKIARILIALSVFVAIIWTIKSSAHQFAQLDLKLSQINFAMIMLAIGSYLLAMMLSCSFWFVALRSLGCNPNWHRVLQAFFASQLGKYVPGKAMVVIIRTDLIRDADTNTVAAAASVFVETLTWIFVGSVIACGLIVTRFPEQAALKWTALSFAILAGFLTFPPIFRKIAIRLTNADSKIFSGLKFPTMAFGWLVMSIGWCFNALSLYLIIDSLPTTNIGWGDFDLSLACVSLATVAGFASLLPGGLGVREIVMIPLLGPRFGTATAIIVAIMIRLIWISAELISSGIIYLSLRIWGRKQLE